MARRFLLALGLAACNRADAGAGDASDDPYTVVHGWPALGDGFVLGQVAGIAIDSTGNLWVFHRPGQPWFGEELTDTIEAPTILRLDAATGAILASFGEAMFVIPHGLRIDANDHLWVTDVGTHRVHELSPTGEVLRTLGEGGAGSDTTHFDGPTDVAFSGDEVFVSDGYGNSRIAVFDRNGAYVREWGSIGDAPGSFFEPHSIVADAEGRLLVADRGNLRIQRFTQDGTFDVEWKGGDIGRPWALDVDASGRIWVVDGGDQKPLPPDRARVYALDPTDGRVLESFGSFGNYDGQLYWGHDIAIGSNDEVFVGDVYYGMRVQKFVRGG